MFTARIAVSIVSHSHGDMVADLVQQLLECSQVKQVLVTCNVPEVLILPIDSRVQRIDNPQPKGFGANHNAAFEHCQAPYFCVLNPDVRFDGNPFPALLNCLGGGVALCAPVVTNPAGLIEDSARQFPSFQGLFSKLVGISDGRYCYGRNDPQLHPDWVAGMFMLFPAADYAALGGFDEKYFLYYEDVDLCVRLWRSGRKIVLCPQATVVHAAQRASHRNLRHLTWHLGSMMRYFIRHWGRLPAVGAQR
ncbi:glycosyltransferase family 2 protein [Azonexus fungiphilus]|uniref:glycosyltransferase family 2 protein n=1 Tax=Azonexus fungiphilus TaxID=146940 RepID=UPI001C2BF328